MYKYGVAFSRAEVIALVKYHGVNFNAFIGAVNIRNPLSRDITRCSVICFCVKNAKSIMFATSCHIIDAFMCAINFHNKL